MRRPLLLMLLLAVAPFGFAPAAAAASYCDGGAYLISGDVVSRFVPAAGLTRVASLPVHVNAVGAGADAFYGIAGRHAVRFSADGTLRDLGPIRGAPASGFAGAYVGTIDGGKWYLLEGDRVYTVALSTLAVTSVATLSMPVRLGDWAYWHGFLIGLSTLDGPTALVRMDPLTGTVSELAHPSGLSRGSIYGATWVLGDRLYALHNGEGRLYSIDLAHPSSAELVASGLRTTSADGAACTVAPPTAPVSPSPTPPPSATPPTPSPPPIVPPIVPPVVPSAIARPGSAPPAITASAPPGTPSAVAQPGIAAPVNPAPPAAKAPRGPHRVSPARADEPAAYPTPTDPIPLRRWIAAAVAVLAIGGLIATRAAK